jgi:hypothetical protein
VVWRRPLRFLFGPLDHVPLDRVRLDHVGLLVEEVLQGSVVEGGEIFVGVRRARRRV